MRLEAADLSVGYPGHVVGKSISLALDTGEVLGLLGPNGAGKTTLFRTLLGLQRPLSGAVMIDGQPLGRLRRLGIGRVVQAEPGERPEPWPGRAAGGGGGERWPIKRVGTPGAGVPVPVLPGQADSARPRR